MRCAATVARRDISRKCADNVRNLPGKRVRKAAVFRAAAKVRTTAKTRPAAVGNLAEDLPVLIATKTVFVENDPCVNFASLDVVSHADWRQLGEASLRPAHVRMRNATGDDMGVTSSTSVRGWCDDKLVEMTAPVTTRGTRNMGSSWKLRVLAMKSK